MHTEFDGVAPASLPCCSSMLRRSPLACVLGLASLLSSACSGNQQGYYDACDEPAGLALGCDSPPRDEFTAWDACRKLAGCGVVWPQVEGDGDDNTQEANFELCVALVEDGQDAQGDVLLTCIQETACPDLVATDPDSTMMDMPNPAEAAIEGVIGYCGRLDPG